MARRDLDRAGAGQRHQVTAGDLVILRLPETPTSGYRWALDGYDPDVLRLAGDEFRPAAGSALGGGGEREFRFSVVGAGSSPLRLARRRAWAGAGGAAEQFEATIEATD
ncbi:protease inhibitor I42 family protein [Micromonospora zhanjiangensis]|uniref:Protease inhibitor I42 family protein n=1 Tax=Micromonospora zhanjiangensis TaxID=1522057 RepID=A0ABV8KV38_9ACTN